MIEFKGKIKGKKEEVEKVLDCFKKASNHQFVVPYKDDVEEEVERAKNFYTADTPHFWNILGVEVVSQGMEDKEYVVDLKGLCSENLADSLLKRGAQRVWGKYKSSDWFKGTSLEDVHKKFPELKVELFSVDLKEGFSEHVLVSEYGVEDEVEDFCVALPEWFKMAHLDFLGYEVVYNI